MSKSITTLRDLLPDDRNANKGTERGSGMLEDSLRVYGAGRSVLADRNGKLIAGNKTVEQAANIGIEDVIVVRTNGKQLVVVQREDLDMDADPRARELALADNYVGQANLEWDAEVLMGLEADGVGVGKYFSTDELAALLDAGSARSEGDVQAAHQTLAQRFGVPPFSVLDARQGYWQERKNAWLALGLRSFEGRKENLLLASSAKPPAVYELRNRMREERGSDPSWPEILAEAEKRGMISPAVSGTSIFDPVLCELAYRWFCPEGGIVLDPFAGGSVRGMVAAKLGRGYIGVDLSQSQVQANHANWQKFKQHCDAATDLHWMVGDSRDLDAVFKGGYEQFDFVFSCPPYADLEVYSDDPRDLSNMSYEEFLAAYRQVIAQSLARLKENRFACFVVGDVRDKKGFYRNFVSDTIAAFQDAGARLYNEAILVTAVGSLAIRVNSQFGKARKLGKTHQNVLVFFKGDPKKIEDILGATEFGTLEEMEGINE